MKAVIFDMYETLITHFIDGVSLYFGAQMAADAGIPEEKFLAIWRPTERDRSIGKISLEEILTRILRENNCYSEELLQKIVQKRIVLNETLFCHLHPEIIPMFQGLKERGILVGLISNCFSEEAQVIRNSVLFPYFDVVCLSYEQGVQKPEQEIYQKCFEMLSEKAELSQKENISKNNLNHVALRPEECLYIGDGGSRELEAAEVFGMKTAQAAWYLKEGTLQPVGRKDGFVQLERPLEVLEYLEKMDMGSQ